MRRLLLVLLTGLVLTPLGMARAVDKLTLTPAVTVTQQYTDNVFYDQRLERADAVTQIKPSLTLSGRSEEGSSRLTLGAKVNEHWRYTELDAVNPYVTLKFDRKLGPRFTVFGTSEYRDESATDPVREGRSVIFGAAPDIAITTVTGGATRLLTPSTSATASFSYLDVDYQDFGDQTYTDYSSRRIGLSWERTLSPIESLGVTTSYQVTPFGRSISDGVPVAEARDDHMARIAATWVRSWSYRLSTSFEGGVRYLRTDGGATLGLFELPSTGGRILLDTTADPSFAFVGTAKISYRTRLSRYSLTLTRETRPDNGSSSSRDVNVISTAFSRNFGRRFSLDAYATYQQSSATSSSLQSINIGFFPSGTCPRFGSLRGRTVCLVEGKSALDSEFWNAGFQLRWRIRQRWSTFVSYGFQKASSDQPNRGDYKANRVTAGFTWSHDVPL